MPSANHVRVGTPQPTPKKARLNAGRVIDNLGSLASVPPCSTPVSNRTLATYAKFYFPYARLKRLSEAFRQSRSYQALTSRRTTQVLNQSAKESSNGSKEGVKPEFLQMFGTLDSMLGVSSKATAGGKAQTQELKRLHAEHKSREASE